MLFVSLADNHLEGSIPDMANLTVLNASSNKLSESLVGKLPGALQLLYLANNSLAGTFPDVMLPSNLSLLDISLNSLSGALPPELPVNLSVLNMSHNSFTGGVASSWGRLQHMAELRLDGNSLTGKLPGVWSAWGGTTGNSLRLSMVDNNLRAPIPSQWVQQFCLAIDRTGESRVLFTPVAISIPGGPVLVGSLIELPAQRASINVTLGGKLYSFDYNSPTSLCSIPHAARNVALAWGIFAALLLATVVCVRLWLRRRAGQSKSSALSKLSRFTAGLRQSKLRILEPAAYKLWFVLSDILYSVYSQVSDAITIHQVFESGQLHYAYALLGILVLPFACMLLLVVRVCTRVCQEKIGSGTSAGQCKIIAAVGGVLMSPCLFLVLELALVGHGLGAPLPAWVESLDVDMFTYYRAQSLAESLLNALPQSIIQTKLYLMGNDPNGIHVYIDTRLFLFSIAGSMLSMLKSVGMFVVERHEYGNTVTEYCMTLVRFRPLVAYSGFNTRVTT